MCPIFSIPLYGNYSMNSCRIRPLVPNVFPWYEYNDECRAWLDYYIYNSSRLMMKQGRIVPLGTSFRLPLNTSFCLFFYSSCLSVLSYLSVYQSDISAFHEHHPPGPELTQLSSPRGKNLCIPVHIHVYVCVCRHTCVYTVCFLWGFNTVHLSFAGALQRQKQSRALLAVATDWAFLKHTTHKEPAAETSRLLTQTETVCVCVSRENKRLVL